MPNDLDDSTYGPLHYSSVNPTCDGGRNDCADWSRVTCPDCLRSKPPDRDVTVSPQAKKVIDALRAKPDLLIEVANHFEDGWPVAKLAHAWELQTDDAEPPVFVRSRYNSSDLVETDYFYVAAITTLTDQGHDGSQWLGSISIESGQVTRRVFDEPFSAAEWADAQLRAAGYALAGPDGPLDPQLIEERERYIRNAEETKAAELAKAKEQAIHQHDLDDIPF
jgi:hypothetical protein